MGCDGGTIPKRDELVKKKKKKEGKDRQADLAAKWKYCAISSTRLRQPIVACLLGRLYNKDALIEFLLKKESSEIAGHVKSLKDVVELRLTPKKDYSEASTADNEDIQDSQFVCPVVGLEMNGKHRFCYIRKCGCVISERALKEVKSDNCHGCGRPYDPTSDSVIINGTPEEVDKLREVMLEMKARTKSKKRKTEPGVTSTESNGAKVDDPPSSSSASSSKTSTSSILPKKSRKEYSVAKDPDASETYKSLFTSHETAKKKPTGNWVTYNPLYF